MKDLQTKAKAVSSPSNFLVFDAKASEDGVASFAATGSAVAASHTLTVQQLASVDRWAFDGVDDATVNLTATAGQTVDFTAMSLEERFRKEASESGMKFAEFVHPMRLAITGRVVSPNLFELVEILGKGRCVVRLLRLLQTVKGALQPA